MNKLGVNLFICVLMISMFFSTNVFATEIETEELNLDGVTYRTHIENEGWAQGWMYNGAKSGSEGKSQRLEAIEIELSGNMPEGMGIQYQTHVQNKGWSQGWVSNGELSGTVAESLRLEAIQIKLTGDTDGDYTVKYRTHIQNDGWKQGWVADGATSGSEGKGLRLEAIEIVIEKTPGKIAYDKYLAVLNQVNEADYTAATWTAYKKVVDVNVVKRDDIANKMTEATLAIEKAQASLVKKADLDIYQDTLNSVKEADYTADSWANYQKVVVANVVTAEDSQSKVDTATIAIIKAQKNLVKLAIMDSYEAARAAVTEDQVKSGWSGYKAVLDANVVNNLNTQAQVDAATANIIEAQKKLVLYSDLTAFNKAIELYIKYGSDAANAPYTAETWNAYTVKCENYGTLTNGAWVYDVITRDSTKTAIEAAVVDINSNIAKLSKTADIAAFNAAKNIKISDGPYTTASFTAYTNDAQVKSITSISADTLKGYSQTVVDGYTNTLIALQNGLLVKGSDLASYNAALAAVKVENYTPASWSAYQTVLAANVVTADTTQSLVDSATAKIIAAQKNLVYSGAYIIKNAKINSINFGVCQVGDNILTRAEDMITAAGFDKTDYTISFTRIDQGTTAINSKTGLITAIGSGTATVTFTMTPIDGGAAATTANVELAINP